MIRVRKYISVNILMIMKQASVHIELPLLRKWRKCYIMLTIIEISCWWANEMKIESLCWRTTLYAKNCWKILDRTDWCFSRLSIYVKICIEIFWMKLETSRHNWTPTSIALSKVKRIIFTRTQSKKSGCTISLRKLTLWIGLLEVEKNCLSSELSNRQYDFDIEIGSFFRKLYTCDVQFDNLWKENWNSWK